MKENLNKRICCVGDISPDKPHIWSKVYRGGVLFIIKCKGLQISCCNGEKTEKKIVIVGKIGNTEYQNNDRCKVLHRGGCTKVIYSACSHGDIPMAVRKCRRK